MPSPTIPVDQPAPDKRLRYRSLAAWQWCFLLVFSLKEFALQLHGAAEKGRLVFSGMEAWLVQIVGIAAGVLLSGVVAPFCLACIIGGLFGRSRPVFLVTLWGSATAVLALSQVGFL